NADVDEAVHNESKIFTVNLASNNEHSQDILLQPYDIVIVKSLPGYSPQRTVLVLGEVMSPGRYGFQRILNINPDSLSLHPRLKDELYKSYDIINVDLHTALTNPGNSENLLLDDGDVLTISKSANLVKISGEVYNPT